MELLDNLDYNHINSMQNKFLIKFNCICYISGDYPVLLKDVEEFSKSCKGVSRLSTLRTQKNILSK